MSNVKIDDSKVKEALTQATLINEKLKDTLQIAKMLNSKLHGESTWKGEAKDSCAAYLDIAVQYHEDILKGMEKHEKLLKKLKKNIKDFETSDFVTTIKDY